MLQKNQINVLQGSCQSPDLNPIEYLWKQTGYPKNNDLKVISREEC